MKDNLTLLLAFLLICLTPLAVHSQNRVCYTSEALQNMLKSEPNMQERMNSIEEHLQEYIQRSPSVKERTVINIPVVVHVIYNTSAENISDAQVQSQIDVLNKDFRKLNSEAPSIPNVFKNIAADVEINFCLAQTAPNGASTNGIERYHTSKTSWPSNDDMKRIEKDGVATWDGTRYLNLWVCNLGSGILGYASFPGSPINTDGVVVDYRYFGTINTRPPFHLGRTTTHEVGHWLNLYHIWGDATCGDDHVDDTPLHHGANYGCPSYPAYNSTCGNNIIEMPMNYMDYTNDVCMSMFTEGQKTRMKALFAPGGARYSFTTSSVCGTHTPVLVCNTPTGLASSNITDSGANIYWKASLNAQTYTIQYKPNNSNVWITIKNIPNNSYVFTGLLPAIPYDVRVSTNCTNGGESAFSDVLNFWTDKKTSPPVVGVVTCNDVFEPNNTRSTAKLVQVNATSNASIGYDNDRDWYYFKVAPGTSFTVRLSDLVNDCDIKMYDSKLRLLKSSENMGTADELITFTSAKQDSFLLQVFGYNGVFDNTKCYSLTIKAGASTFKAPNGTVDMGDQSFNRLGGEEGELKIYPNPAHDAVGISINPHTDADATISLINTAGQVLLTEKHWMSKKENYVQLNLSTIQTGLYLILVRQGDQVWTKRVVKN